MFAEPPSTKEDLQQAAKIQHKQRIENERKARIFNPRSRLIGLDCDGLARQLSEKEQQQKHDNEIDQKHEAEQQKHTQLLERKTQQWQAEREHAHREMNIFRQQHQRKELASAFDLNDPQYKRKSLPARIGDNDPRLTVSSAQIFDGEDLGHGERQRQQQAQQRAWLQQQMREKNEAKTNAGNTDRQMQQMMQTHAERMRELNNGEQQLRRRIFAANADFNRAMAEEQRGRKARERQEEEMDNLAEQYNNRTSEMLLESKELAGSQFGGRRKLVTMYKGMTEEQLREFHQKKQMQLDEQQRMRDQRREEEKRFEELVMDFDRNAVLKERQQRGEYQRQMANDMQENQMLAKVQSTTKSHLEQEVYTNPPTEEYFAQFNTTSR